MAEKKVQFRESKEKRAGREGWGGQCEDEGVNDKGEVGRH